MYVVENYRECIYQGVFCQLKYIWVDVILSRNLNGFSMLCFIWMMVTIKLIFACGT